MNPSWHTYNPNGKYRVIVTKTLPGSRWIDILTAAECRVDVCQEKSVLGNETIRAAMGHRCHGAIGQLTESWGESLFTALKAAGGTAYSNYAVGYNNVDLAAATRAGIPVGNTPGVLTETTAEMAVALTFAAARRIGEAERYMRAGRFENWLPDLFLGNLLTGRTLGVIGAGRIGSAYARMMVQGHGLSLIYHNLHGNPHLETFVARYSEFRASQGLPPVTCRRAKNLEDLLESADCVSIHTVLDDSTHHLIGAHTLGRMRANAILVNTSRGPVIDEAALVDHCRRHPDFRVGLDVFENEPDMAPGLAELDNVIVVPHIASATRWTREGMAILAACNVAGLLRGDPLWRKPDVMPFLGDHPPRAIPSIVNAEEWGVFA